MIRNAPTLGEALEWFQRIIAVGNPPLTVSFHRSGDKMVFEFGSAVPLGRIADFVGLVGVALVYRAAASHAFDKIADMKVQLTRPEDQLSALLRSSMLCEVEFGQRSNCLTMPAQWVDAPNDDRDEALWILAKERLQHQSSAVDGTLTLVRIRQRIAKIIHDAHRVPHLEEIATQEHVSVRTIVRIIGAHGTKFQTIVAEERRMLAAQLINDTSLTLADLASALGFANMSSFSRAFRQWFGVTPGTMRKEIQERG